MRASLCISLQPLFEKALVEAGVEDESRQRIIEQVLERGTCRDIPEVPEHIRRIFVVSQDIDAEEQVRMQAALQAFVDNSLSKTINFPASATDNDVAQAYQLAWKLGCKGITVYVTGSRQKVVLETQATVKDKNQQTESTQPPQVEDLTVLHDIKKPRPRSLKGQTYNVSTPLGKAFVTININGDNQPFEVFVNTAKAGSDTAAVSEAIGRLISYILRLSSPIAPRERLKEVWRQLSGIGGGRSLGFGPNRVRSLPDGVARVIAEYLEAPPMYEKEEIGEDNDPRHGNGDNLRNEIALSSSQESGKSQSFKIGDLCPDCGQAAVVNEEGCRKCYACGFSEC
jgi:ribonucleoside-diphosphate reductase alpha chain